MSSSKLSSKLTSSTTAGSTSMLNMGVRIFFYTYFDFVKKNFMTHIFLRWANLLVNPNKFSLIHFGGIHGFTPKTIKANLVSCLDQIFVQSEFPNKTGNIINFRPGFKYLQCITFFKIYTECILQFECRWYMWVPNFQ